MKASQSAMIGNVRAELLSCEKGIQERISSLARDVLHADLIKVLQACLEKLAEGLYKAALESTSPEAHECFNFYFWPGYDSIHQKEGSSSRITCSCPIDGEEIPCGVGFFNKETYHLAPTSLWYWAVLTEYNGGTGSFIPGSTHAWMSRARVQGRFSLETLIIQHSSLARTTGVLRDDSYRVALARRRFTEWAQDIARQLKQELTLPWPYSAQSDELSVLRQELYNIWLTASFCPQDLEQSGLFEGLKARLDALSGANCLEGYGDRVDRARRLGMQCVSDQRRKAFCFWYSLRVEEHQFRGGLAPLGSAMMLSSAQLPNWYLAQAKRFVDRIYGIFRLMEHQVHPVADTFELRVWPEDSKNFYADTEGAAVPHSWERLSREGPDVLNSCCAALRTYLTRLLGYSPPDVWFAEQFKYLHEDLKCLIGDFAVSSVERREQRYLRNLTVGNAAILLAAVDSPHSQTWIEKVTWTADNSGSKWQILPDQSYGQSRSAIRALAAKAGMFHYLCTHERTGSPLVQDVIFAPGRLAIVLGLDPHERDPEHGGTLLERLRDPKGRKGDTLKSVDTFLAYARTSDEGWVSRCAVSLRESTDNSARTILEIATCTPSS